MQVIQFWDNTGQTMVARWPREGTGAIVLGSQLVVEEDQQATFLRDGKAADTFSPGRHTLTTANLPLLWKLFGIPFEGKSPFQAAVIFTALKTFTDLKWGTKEPVVYRDKELAMVRLRAFGKFAVRIAEPRTFVDKLVGSMGLYTTDGVESYFKDAIVARLQDLLGETLQSILDLPREYDELAAALKQRTAQDLGAYGIELVDLWIGAITPPEEVQKQIDERSGMAAVGDLNAYMKYKTAQAVGDAARQEGGMAGTTVGAGMGAGIGMMLPQMMKEAMQSASPPAAGAPAASSSPASRFCAQCGSALPDGARFCAQCGTKIS